MKLVDSFVHWLGICLPKFGNYSIRVLLMATHLNALALVGDDNPGCQRALETPLFAILQSYVGEDIETIVPGCPPLWGPRACKVQYLTTEEERSQARLTIRNGQLFVGNERLSCNFPLLGCSRIFVVGPDGTIYIGKDRTYKFHHSSFLAGGQVMAAGRIRIIGDKIVSIDNFSGHYRPTARSNVAALKAILNAGLNLPRKLGFVGSYPGPFNYGSVRYLKFSKALETWRAGQTYSLSEVDQQVIQELRDVLKMAGYLGP